MAVSNGANSIVARTAVLMAIAMLGWQCPGAEKTDMQLQVENALRAISDSGRIGEEEYLQKAREILPFDSLDCQVALRSVLRRTLDPWETSGMAVLLTAQRSKGMVFCLWVLQENSPLVRKHVLWRARYLRYREFIDICISLMNDKGSFPVASWEEHEPPPPHRFEHRVCDIAMLNAVWALERAEAIPVEVAKPLHIRSSDSYEVRDQRIADFQEWWRRKGLTDPVVQKAFPSVVEDLLRNKSREPEE